MFKKIWHSIKLKYENTLDTQLSNTTNPYLASRLEWNYLFSDLIKAKKNWRWATFISLVGNIILIAHVIIFCSQSCLVPYIVKVNELGNVIYGGFLDQKKTITPMEVNAFLRQFIINTRSVLLDPFAQKKNIEFVYSTSLPPVRKILDSFYQSQNPLQLSKQKVIEVQIQGVIQKSKRTWQVDWLEIHRDLDGQITHQTHWEALITISHFNVKNPDILNSNPLGLFIQQMSWAEQIHSE